MVWIAAAAALILLALAAYWMLVTTEGVFLGRRVVIWLYDLTAGRYDAIKQFSSIDDSFYLARPIIRLVQAKARPRLLDVATGTGRLPRILLEQDDFHGFIAGLDASYEMLSQARVKLSGMDHDAHGASDLIQQYATPLPFPDDAFDLISCLEALEFFPSDEEALDEMVRVLAPGGSLVITRRKGRQAKLYLSHYRTREEFESMLQRRGLEDIQSSLWEVDYDMVTARKPAGSEEKVGSST